MVMESSGGETMAVVRKLFHEYFTKIRNRTIRLKLILTIVHILTQTAFVICVEL